MRPSEPRVRGPLDLTLQEEMIDLPKLALKLMIGSVCFFALILLVLLANLLINWDQASGDKVAAVFFFTFIILGLLGVATILYLFREKIVDFYYKASDGK